MKIYLIKDNDRRWQYLNAKGEAHHKAYPTHTLMYWYARVSSDNSIDMIICVNGLTLPELKELRSMGFSAHEEHFNMFIKR